MYVCLYVCMYVCRCVCGDSSGLEKNNIMYIVVGVLQRWLSMVWC